MGLSQFNLNLHRIGVTALVLAQLIIGASAAAADLPREESFSVETLERLRRLEAEDRFQEHAAVLLQGLLVNRFTPEQIQQKAQQARQAHSRLLELMGSSENSDIDFITQMSEMLHSLHPLISRRRFEAILDKVMQTPGVLMSRSEAVSETLRDAFFSVRGGSQCWGTELTETMLKSKGFDSLLLLQTLTSRRVTIATARNGQWLTLMELGRITCQIDAGHSWTLKTEDIDDSASQLEDVDRECVSSKDLQRNYALLGWQRFGTGISERGFRVWLMHRPLTHSWTLLESGANGLTCEVTQGAKLNIAPSKVSSL